LLKRERDRVPGQAFDDRFHQPSNLSWNIAAQPNRLYFRIDSAILLLESGDAVQPPNVAVPLVRR
jgi:hypothetical protein